MRIIYASSIFIMIALTVFNTLGIYSMSKSMDRQRSLDNANQALKCRNIANGAYDIKITAYQAKSDPAHDDGSCIMIQANNVGNTTILSGSYSILAVSETGMTMEIDPGIREILIGTSIKVKVRSVIITSQLGIGNGGLLKIIAIEKNGGCDYNANDNHVVVVFDKSGKMATKAAQQVDSAEASTIAVRPSIPSGSPR